MASFGKGLHCIGNCIIGPWTSVIGYHLNGGKTIEGNVDVRCFQGPGRNLWLLHACRNWQQERDYTWRKKYQHLSQIDQRMPRNNGNHVLPSPNLDYHFLPTGKVGKNGEGELLVIGDYKYRVKVQTPSGRRYWECSHRHCSAKAITSGSKLISYVEDHVHNSSANRVKRPSSPVIETSDKNTTRNNGFEDESAFSNLAFVKSEYPSFVYNPRPVVFPSPIPMEQGGNAAEEAKNSGDAANTMSIPDASETVSLNPTESGESVSTVEPAKSNSESLPNGISNITPDEAVLLSPYEYIRQVPGKAIRSKLSLAFNHWLKISDEKLKRICEIVEMLHNASLIIDDIEDNSNLRRGMPVAHKVFGIASCINSANYVYFIGLEKCLRLDSTEAVNIFTEQLLQLHRGQGLDIHWRDTYTCPTEEEYKQMVIWKTGGLFGLAVRLMQLFSEDKRDYGGLLNSLGLFFQIRDDYANLISTDYHDSKTYCEDLTEGKYSFPVIHAIQHHPNDHQVSGILRQRTTDMDVKRYCVKHLEKLGSIEYTKKILLQLEEEICRLLDEFGGNSFLSHLIKELSKLFKDSTSAKETNKS